MFNYNTSEDVILSLLQSRFHESESREFLLSVMEADAVQPSYDIAKRLLNRQCRITGKQSHALLCCCEKHGIGIRTERPLPGFVPDGFVGVGNRFTVTISDSRGKTAEQKCLIADPEARSGSVADGLSRLPMDGSLAKGAYGLKEGDEFDYEHLGRMFHGRIVEVRS